MNLIDRYVYEVGRHLPRKNRSDIQIELRSSLVDALEDRAGENPNEADIIALLQEFGPPKTVAASYFPEGQYLIGPSLYPLFRMVAGIALAAVIGAQVLAWGVAVFIAEVPFAPLEAFGGILNSIPIALGMVVIVFAILQRFDVRPDFEDERWDPASLPQISDFEPVSRGERIFGIIVSIIILGVVTSFPGIIGFVTFPGGEFYANPVIPQYLGWISISLLLGIGLDIYLLWQGRWTSTSRTRKNRCKYFEYHRLILACPGAHCLAGRARGWRLSVNPDSPLYGYRQEHSGDRHAGVADGIWNRINCHSDRHAGCPLSAGQS